MDHHIINTSPVMDSAFNVRAFPLIPSQWPDSGCGRMRASPRQEPGLKVARNRVAN